MEKKYWEVIGEMDDDKLTEFIKEFVRKRFGGSSVEDKPYIETWFKRLREEEGYVKKYMDAKSRAVFFSMITEVDKHENKL